jgi:N6-adenosine-specific RNA methylase IME4
MRAETTTFDWRAHLDVHPLADLFPLIEGAEFAELVADVKAHGVREPVWLIDGQILDGRNRYRASHAAGVDCPTRTYDGSDPVGFVISANLRRRHLDESQRAMVAAKLATLAHGGDRSKSPNGDLTQQQAADLLNVGKRSVERAAEVRDGGAPELQHAVERGAVSVSAAADVATLPQAEQAEIVAQGERQILLAAKEIRNRRAASRRAERIERIVEISKGNKALDIAKAYPLVLADPPWKFKVYDNETGLDNSPDAHYPTMETTDIAALEIPAAKHSILFLWTTVPHLPQALEVMTAWGFEYRSNFVWVKDRAGLGYRVRNQHEHLLLGVRGDIPPPSPTPASVIKADRREHSRKPDAAYELIERMYPEFPKIELFARQGRKGWAAWGNQAPLAKAA